MALLFVGLQIATLFHGAQFGEGHRDHAHRSVSEFWTVELDGLSRVGHPFGDRSHGESHCDLEFFCEKLSKLITVDAAFLGTVDWAYPSIEYAFQALIQVRRASAYARAPPILLHF